MKHSFFNLSVVLAILTLSTLTSCCKDDKQENEKTVPSDSQAGKFSVSNLSYQEEGEKLSLTALTGDTLKISFSPKQEYANMKFSLNCEGLEQINDSLYKVIETEDGDHTYKLFAEYENKTGVTSAYYTATSELKISIPKTYIIIPYKMTMSSDLKELVTPEITYTDSEGKSHIFSVSEDKLLKNQIEDVINYSYIYKVRYYKTGITSTFTVKYVPKQNVAYERDRYYLSHSLDRMRAGIHIPNQTNIDIYNSFDINIKIGGDNGIAKEDIAATLAELSNTPDVIKLNIFNGSNGIDKIVE